jgi:hypothetical protein
MAKKQTIYVVSNNENTIIRASRSYQGALDFSVSLKSDTYYLCTSEFSNLKKGDSMSNVESFL